jgi:hypothetical protein
MTASDFVERLAPIDLDRQALIFAYLAEHIHEARLASGMGLLDLSDVRAFLHEVALTAKVSRRDFRVKA